MLITESDAIEMRRAQLEMRVAGTPGDAQAWQMLGFAYAEEQRMPDALRALRRAADLDPTQPLTAMAHAQATLDAGLPAVELFARARELAPNSLDAVAGEAAARSARGEVAAAEDLLVQTLTRHPEWLLGHKNLCALRWNSGDSQHFARSYAAACRQQPRNLPLWLARFSALAQARDWSGALAIVAEGEIHMGANSAFAIARAFIAGESGDHDLAQQLFEKSEGIQDEVLKIAQLRHCLRTGRVEKAEELAQRLLQSPAAAAIWPYLSLIWRLRGDNRAAWLDGAPPYIRVIDLDYSASELRSLAEVLQGLYTSGAPHLEQSVRGGTQTDPDRPLFFRAEPEIQMVRAKVSEAVRDYVAALPPPVEGHPLLGIPRGRIRFSGSWSVRLMPQGFHVGHTHPKGWISSALYIALPSPSQLGAPPAGWIRFGAAPQGLGVNLPAYAQFEPKPGRLILFPATMWHETLPFYDGERLVIAFDVMRPRSSSPR